MKKSILLAACSNKSSDKNFSISDGEKEKYIETAQNTITLFNEQKSDEIREISDEILKNALTDDKLSEIYEHLKTCGEFEKFLESNITGVEQNDQTFIVVVQQAKYKENTLTYTISFDKDEKLAGIFYK